MSEEPKKVKLDYSAKSGSEDNAIVKKDGFPDNPFNPGYKLEDPVDSYKHVKKDLDKPKKA